MTPVQTAKRIGRGTLKRQNWLQLFQFGLVGASGYKTLGAAASTATSLLWS